MEDHKTPNKPLNRLRAAAGLIPVIESCLRDSKMSPDKAAFMAEFCAWSLEHSLADNEEALQLTAKVQQGLERIKAVLA